jgi:hypothetical protein
MQPVKQRRKQAYIKTKIIAAMAEPIKIKYPPFISKIHCTTTL